MNRIQQTTSFLILLNRLVLLIPLLVLFPLSGEERPLQLEHKPQKTSYKEITAQGRQLLREEEKESALLVFQEALREKTIPPSSLLVTLGQIHADLSQFDEIIALSQTYPKGLKNFSFLLLLSKAYYKKGELEQSRAKLHLALKRRKKLTLENSLLLSELYLNHGNPEGALSILRGKQRHHDHPALAQLKGEALMATGRYEEAGEQFLRSKNPNGAFEAYLLAADSPHLTPGERYQNLFRAESLRKNHQESLLFHLFLVRYHLSGDPLAIKGINDLSPNLNELDPRTLYLLSRLAQSSHEREKVIQSLLQAPSNNPYIALAWFYQGLHDFSEGEKEFSKEKLFRASEAFSKVTSLPNQILPELSSLAYIMKIRSLVLTGDLDGLNEALNLTENSPSQTSEIRLLKALILCEQQIKNTLPERKDEALSLLYEIAANMKGTPFGAEAELALARNHYLEKNWDEAEKGYTKTYQNYKQFREGAEALYFSAKSREAKGETPVELYHQFVNEYPTSPRAPQAYLSEFSRESYALQSPDAIDHLERMEALFPGAPQLIEAFFLIGMDLQKERRTSSGKLLRERDLFEATKNYQKAYDLYQHIASALPRKTLDYYQTLALNALMQKGICQKQIGEFSEGMKQTLYYQYANDSFKQLAKELASQPIKQNGPTEPPISELLLEGNYRLAETYRILGDHDQSETLLHDMISLLTTRGITKGYYLSRVYYDLAMLAKLKGKGKEPLELLKKAEEAAAGNILTGDQQLNLKIEQSECYLHLGEDETAMKILSEVINENLASQERLKAMFLRSEIYALQGREELAKKQLKSLSALQGMWAEKAKERLATYD